MLPQAPSAAAPAHAAPSHTTMSEAPREPRRERRLPFRVPCRVRLVETPAGHVRTVHGETLNISRSGLSLQLSIDPPIGTWVETLVPHVHGDPLFLCGTVIHTRRTLAHGFEVGIRTTDPPAFL